MTWKVSSGGSIILEVAALTVTGDIGVVSGVTIGGTVAAVGECTFSPALVLTLTNTTTLATLATLTITVAGTFTFSGTYAAGIPYKVTASGGSCPVSITNASGIVGTTAITNITATIANYSGAVAIYTNLKDAVAEYTARVTEPTYFDRIFVELLSWKLAALIAPSLTNGDPYKKGERAEKKYLEVLSQHRAHVLNTVQDYPQPDSEFISVRL